MQEGTMQEGAIGSYGRFHVQFMSFYRELVKSGDPQAFFDDKANAARAYGAFDKSDNSGTESWTLTVSSLSCCMSCMNF